MFEATNLQEKKKMKDKKNKGRLGILGKNDFSKIHIVSAYLYHISLSTFYTVQFSLSWHIQLTQQLTFCNYFFCTNPPTHTEALHMLHTVVQHTTYFYQVNTTPINPFSLKNLVLKVRQLNKVPSPPPPLKEPCPQGEETGCEEYKEAPKLHQQ